MNPQRLIGAIRIFGPIVIAVLLVIGVVWLQTADRREPADSAKMYRYKLSQLSDEQIRLLHERAVLESAEREARRAEASISQAQERAMYLERCADPAYQARNRTSCAAPVMGLGIQLPSAGVDAVFDEMVLGLCAYASSRRDARELGCLP